MITIDNETSAMISLVGMLFDAVGGLYLAYDLLGGEKGPLSTFTRIITYSLLISTIYSVTMGLRFGLMAGLSFGAAIGLHLDRLGRGIKDTPRFLLSISALRAFGLGLAVLTIGHPFAAGVTATVVFLASMFLPAMKISPEMLLEPGSKRPSISKKKLMLTMLFGCLALFCDFLCIAVGINSKFAIQEMARMTLSVILTIFFVSLVCPMIEWYADNAEPKVLGYLGAILFIIGFFIQSLPSLLIVLK